MASSESKGLIFDIQGHSLHDGPGTRTVLFFSGCPLRCRWCANPEGRSPRPRLMYKAHLCRECPFRCVAACPHGAARASRGGPAPVVFDRGACDRCETMDCLEVCYRQALQPSAHWYTVAELMRILQRDRGYWGPEGGVTLSGGEPLAQPSFVLELLERCRDATITSCLETSAHVPWPVMESVLPLIEWLFVDIKHMDPVKHAAGTGVSNDLVLRNIRAIAASGWKVRMIVRVPVVEDYNDSPASARAVARFLKEVGLTEVNLLPFHQLGASKYEQLGMRNEYAGRAGRAAAALEPLAQVYRSEGIACYLGADTPF